ECHVEAIDVVALSPCEDVDGFAMGDDGFAPDDGLIGLAVMRMPGTVAGSAPAEFSEAAEEILGETLGCGVDGEGLDVGRIEGDGVGGGAFADGRGRGAMFDRVGMCGLLRSLGNRRLLQGVRVVIASAA